MSVIDEIAAERRRQMAIEGWDKQHDDSHDEGELARAAAAYAISAAAADCGFKDSRTGEWTEHRLRQLQEIWPAAWGWHWFKPQDPRRDLVRAAALLVAEIERLDRAKASK